MTKVVNIYKESYDIYLGRPGKGQEGYFGNPHIIGFCKICNRIHDREDCIKEYKVYFDRRIKNDPEFKKRILELKNCVLGCFCKNSDGNGPICHGDIIANYVDNHKE